MVDILSFAEGLLDASFRGIPFGIPDIRHEYGRRVQRFTFPGQDEAAFQDLGADDGPIRLRGLIVGDDYIARMQALAQAFRTPGAATLVHPWLGELLVVARPASFSFDQTKYRVVAFEAELWLASPGQGTTPDTLGEILAAIAGVEAAARALLAQVLAPVALTLRVVGAVEGFVSGMAATFLPLASLQLPGVAAALASLSAVGLALDGSYGGAVADRIAGPALAAQAAANPPLPSAVGPGDAATSVTPADPAAVSAALLASAAAIAGTGAPEAALAAAAQALVVAPAIGVAADIGFVSQQDALAWRDREDAALAAALDAAAALAGQYPLLAGPLWQALGALRAALALDMQAAIGRLPAVVALTLPGPAPLWLVAHHLSGDRPADMLARFTDLAARNDIGQPGMVAGTLEALAGGVAA